MNIPYRVPLKVASDSAAYELGVSHPQAVTLDMTTGVYAEIGEHYQGNYEVTPTENEQALTTNALIMDDDVTVHAIPSDYVGSAIPRKDSLNVSGATVTADSGYYENGASATMPAGSRGNSTVYISTTATEKKYTVKHDNATSGYYDANSLKTDGVVVFHRQQETVTPSTTSQTVTPTGSTYYLDSVTVDAVPAARFRGVLTPTFTRHEISVDANGEISSGVEVGGSDSPIYQDGWGTTTDEVYMYNQGGVSYQLPTQSATTVTPNDTQQTIVLAGKFTTGDIKVDPIPRTVNDFLGRDAEYIRDIHSHDYVLSSTGYNSWTPSTTASSIVAAQSLTAFAGDLANYEYCVRWLFDAGIKYNTGTTQKAIILREVEEVWQVIAKRPSSLANIGANNFNGNNCSTYFTAALMDYYNTSGTRTFTWSASYGLYLSMTAATFSNSTSDTPNITIKTPAIYARCSNTYFSTARAADVDKANSKMAIKGELYRVKKDSSPSRIMFGHVVDLYNDSIIS